nr:recombinase zinc beta ribbon domain-containing protein [Acidobacteriota bacterium]
PHDVLWQPASNSRVLAILSNPAYAGAYVYGRSTFEATRRKPGRLRSGQVRRPLEKWPVCLQNIYPAYITWEQYLAHRARLHDNQNRYEAGRHGVPRKGQALLQGVVLCGRCGARMGLHYSGPQGEYPVYGCNAGQHQYGSPRCQEVRALGLDAEVERLLLAALEPDKIALALSALAELEKETAMLDRQWHLRLERAKYEAERARRQYMTVEPENRMVARSLERQWEEKLRGVEEVEHAYQRWSTQQQLVITPADRQEILALGENLAQVWRAPTTTNADRKTMLRLVIRDVIVDNKREHGRVWFRINWQTGATSEHWLTRRVQSYAEHPQLEHLRRRVRELNAAQKMDEEIAMILNEEGVRPSRGLAFSGGLVWMVRQQWQIPTVKENGKEANPLRWKDGTYSVEGVASAVGVILGTVYKWVRERRVDAEQLAKGMPWKIKLTDEQIASLREYVKRVRRIKRSKKEAS